MHFFAYCIQKTNENTLWVTYRKEEKFVSGKSFVKGAVVLSIAGIAAKCLGALYRIPFARIASDGCGAIYSMVYPLYNLLLALSTAGIPLAISKLVAEYEEQGKSGMSLRILKLSLGKALDDSTCGPRHKSTKSRKV